MLQFSWFICFFSFFHSFLKKEKTSTLCYGKKNCWVQRDNLSVLSGAIINMRYVWQLGLINRMIGTDRVIAVFHKWSGPSKLTKYCIRNNIVDNNILLFVQMLKWVQPRRGSKWVPFIVLNLSNCTICSFLSLNTGGKSGEEMFAMSCR